jgi:hypothetical protein
MLSMITSGCGMIHATSTASRTSLDHQHRQPSNDAKRSLADSDRVAHREIDSRPKMSNRRSDASTTSLVDLAAANWPTGQENTFRSSDDIKRRLAGRLFTVLVWTEGHHAAMKRGSCRVKIGE